MFLDLGLARDVEDNSVWEVLFHGVLAQVAAVGNGNACGGRDFEGAAVLWDDAWILNALGVCVGGGLFLFFYFEGEVHFAYDVGCSVGYAYWVECFPDGVCVVVVL